LTICNTRTSPPALNNLLQQIVGDSSFSCLSAWICQHLWHSNEHKPSKTAITLPLLTYRVEHTASVVMQWSQIS
jgi:hypothetical protein